MPTKSQSEHLSQETGQLRRSTHTRQILDSGSAFTGTSWGWAERGHTGPELSVENLVLKKGGSPVKH